MKSWRSLALFASTLMPGCPAFVSADYEIRSDEPSSAGGTSGIRTRRYLSPMISPAMYGLSFGALLARRPVAGRPAPWCDAELMTA